MSLFESLGGSSPIPNASPLGNIQNVLNRFQQFKQAFTGNPQQQVQQLLNSGKVSQAQYNQAVQLAQQLQKLMK